MSMTDPISDFLARIRNAIIGRKVMVSAPASNLKVKLAEIMKAEGYIRSFELKPDNRQGILEVELKYDRENRCAIEGMKRISSPGQRRYAKTTEVPKVRNGLGIAIITTSQGLMTDREARKRTLGGEVICAIW